MKKQKRTINDMKPLNCLILCLSTLAFTPAFGQQPEAPRPPRPPGPSVPDVDVRAEAPKLTKFDLDFPGGTPKQLIAAIGKAMDKPVNAIIPDKHADVRLPPLKMNNVDVSQLFEALQRASLTSEIYVTGTHYGSGYGGTPSQSYQILNTSYGFRTTGKLSDDSIWYFFSDGAPTPPPSSATKACRFYSLSPYLERGMTVDDITTAIQTGWKMLGDKETPTINYHKDTKLLIAVGEPNKLETIDSVLKALAPAPQEKAVSASEKPASTQKPAEKPKTAN